jgi:hypothetical protein
MAGQPRTAPGQVGGWLPGRILASAGWTGLVALTCGAVLVAAVAMGLLLVRAR